MLERAYKYVQAPKAKVEVKASAKPVVKRHDKRHPMSGRYCS